MFHYFVSPRWYSYLQAMIWKSFLFIVFRSFSQETLKISTYSWWHHVYPCKTAMMMQFTVFWENIKQLFWKFLNKWATVNVTDIETHNTSPVLDTFFCNMKRKETHFLSSSIDDSTKTFIKRNHRGKRCIIHDLA